jgi:CBS domain-containing protein
MANTIREIMTPNPVALSKDATVQDAAREMKSKDIGHVIVKDNGKICGIVTDRDLVVRAMTEPKDPRTMKLADVCTRQVVSVGPDAPIDEAVQLMRQHAIRRLTVVANGTIVGVVSLGDLAVERDQKSALGEISKAPANN